MNGRHLGVAIALSLTALACGGAQPAASTATQGNQAQGNQAQGNQAEPDVDAKSNEKAGVAAAEAWLALVDAGKYAESWDAAAGEFKRAVKQNDWAEMVAVVREPLGKVSSRRLRAAEYKASLPGAPEGKYVLIQFETAFEKRQAVETVTPMLEADGTWKVSGYFVK
jgi:uncharacterized protein DUF4019